MAESEYDSTNSALDKSALIESPYIPATRTRFVQPGKIEIDANERAVIGKRNAAFSFAPSSILPLTIYGVGMIMKVEWVDGFKIKAVVQNGEIVISANREGMLSLAKQLTALADGVPGDHIHYDEQNSLEEGSADMIIERV